MDDQVRLSEFVRLHTSHEVRLRGLAYSLVPNWADAEEILQQSNLILWTKFDTFRLGTNYLAWASRVVRLTAKDFLGRQRRAKVQFSDMFYDVVADDTVDAAEELAERERLLHRCIQKLSERQRTILQLRYYSAQPVADVGRAVGITSKAVYHALEHIHKALLECVGRHLREPGAE